MYSHNKVLAEQLLDHEVDPVGWTAILKTASIVSWCSESKKDWASVFHSEVFRVSASSTIMSLKSGIQESDYQDIELVKLAPLLLQTIEWNSKLFPDKLV